MLVKSIELTCRSFRNLADECRFKFDASPVTVLYGENGVGKTNVLEALSLFAVSRGIRQCSLSSISKAILPPAGGDGGASGDDAGTSSFWDVGLALDLGASRRNFRVSYAPYHSAAYSAGQTGRRGRRQFFEDGKKTNQAALHACGLRMLCMTPGEGGLIARDASQRRRFIDDFATQLDAQHGRRLRSYQNSTRGRLAHLRERSSAMWDRHWLDTIEEGIAMGAVSLLAMRSEVVEHLNKLAKNFSDPLPKVSLTISSSVLSQLESKPARQVEQGIIDVLRAGRSSDADSGRTESSPASAAIDVYLNGLGGELTSTGEQMLISLALLYAAARDLKLAVGEYPWLLMDDALAHLDDHNRKQIAQVFVDLGTRLFLTGPQRNIFQDWQSSAQYIAIKAGKVDS